MIARISLNKDVIIKIAPYNNPGELLEFEVGRASKKVGDKTVIPVIG
jgi:hypothetical protein